MADDTAKLVEAAWRAMWQQGSRYYIPAAIERGITGARVRVPSFRVLSLANIGPVTLFNEPPWNGVAIDLTNNRVDLSGGVTSAAFKYDPGSGEVSAEISFPKVLFASFYLVQSGGSVPSSMRLAAETLGMVDESAESVGDSPQIALSKSYQDQLLSNEHGARTVATYWDNNEAYNHVFTYDAKLKFGWTKLPTASKTTKAYAAQTFSAAQPGVTTPVQGAVSSNGYSDYTAHSWLQAVNVQQACVRASSAATTKEEQERFAIAASAAFSFQQVTSGTATQPITVSAVVSKVSVGTPGLSTETEELAEYSQPDWVAEVYRRAEEFNRAPLPTGEEDYHGALVAPLATHRRTPARGTSENELSLEGLILRGQVVASGKGGAPSVEFTSLEGRCPTIELQLSPFEGELFDKVRAAVDRSEFLRDAVTQRVDAALTGERFRSFLGRVMNLALAGELGPVVL